MTSGDGRSGIGIRPSFAHLIRPLGAASTQGVAPDVVAVPAHRGLGNLQVAAHLATELDADLVALVDDDGVARGVAQELAYRHPTLRVWAVHGRWRARFVRGCPLRMPKLHLANGHLAATPRQQDIGTRRNAALLLAAGVGWRSILFLDDDITGVRSEDCRRATSALADPSLRAVAWPYPDYPDNSVVFHARRAVGDEPHIFVGSGALLVKVDADTPHFSTIYNEDWLFIDGIVHAPNTGLAFADWAFQDPINPFEDAQRARDEELGDVFAEGLYAMRARQADPGDRVLWRDELRRRETLLDTVDARLAMHGVAEGVSAASVSASIGAARRALGSITPVDLVRVYEAWQDDAQTWTHALREQLETGPGRADPSTIAAVCAALGVGVVGNG